MKYLFLILFSVNAFAFPTASEAKKLSFSNMMKKITEKIESAITDGECSIDLYLPSAEIKQKLIESGYQISQIQYGTEYSLNISWCK